jgi:hypothetical protein
MDITTVAAAGSLSASTKAAVTDGSLFAPNYLQAET